MNIFVGTNLLPNNKPRRNPNQQPNNQVPGMITSPSIHKPNFGARIRDKFFDFKQPPPQNDVELSEEALQRIEVEKKVNEAKALLLSEDNPGNLTPEVLEILKNCKVSVSETDDPNGSAQFKDSIDKKGNRTGEIIFDAADFTDEQGSLENITKILTHEAVHGAEYINGHRSENPTTDEKLAEEALCEKTAVMTCAALIEKGELEDFKIPPLSQEMTVLELAQDEDALDAGIDSWLDGYRERYDEQGAPSAQVINQGTMKIGNTEFKLGDGLGDTYFIEPRPNTQDAYQVCYTEEGKDTPVTAGFIVQKGTKHDFINPEGKFERVDYPGSGNDGKWIMQKTPLFKRR